MQFLSWKIYKLFFQLWSVECGIFLICRSFSVSEKDGMGKQSCDCFLLDFYFGSSLFAAGKRDGDFCAAWTDSFDLSVGINGGNFFVRRAVRFYFVTFG